MIKKDLLLLCHMGIGDYILCNGLIRELYNKYNITIFSKNIYVRQISIMFEDLTDLKIISVINDSEALNYVTNYKKYYDEFLALGFFGNNFLKNNLTFDQSFYEQANIDYLLRIKNFKIGGKTNILKTDLLEYNFVHDDSKRDYNIDKKYLSGAIYRPNQNFDYLEGNTIFDYEKIILNSKEIHCMNSSFACYIDSCSIFKNKKKYLHDYVKQEKDFHYFSLNTLNNWEIIKRR